MAKRRYFTKSIDPDQLATIQQRHISSSDYGTDIALGEYAEHQCSIVFFDLVNFTNISWGLQRKEIFDILHPLFKETCLRIYKHKGMVDKYPGDGVVGFFPRHFGESKNTIVEQALDCVAGVFRWFYEGFRDRFTLSKPSHSLELSCGIDAGNVAIAHVGTPLHSELILLVSCQA